ncbi:hypothetical protein NBRC116188_25150 [Oceaniserpentilla sp. 4NH20-0058]
MEKEGRPAIKEVEQQSLRQTGEATMALLTEYLENAATLSMSMANTAESLPLDKSLFSRVFHHALEHNKISDFVAGGGIWPEPNAFKANTERFSFFWGKNQHGKLSPFDDYNKPSGSGYHQEEWYIPAKHIQPGKVYWSRSYVDPYTLEPMITATSPIYRDETFFGVATVDIMLSALNNLLKQQSKRFGGYAYVLDRSGTFLSFPDDAISKRKVKTENNQEKLQYISIQQAAQATPFLPVIDDALAAMDGISRLNRELSITAQTLALESYQITLDEGFRIASVITDPLAKKNIGNSFIKQIDQDNDPILKEPVSLQVFHIPDLYAKLILVVPKRLLNLKTDNIVGSVLWVFTLVIVFGLVLGLLYLEWILLSPLKRMREQVMKFDHSHDIHVDNQGELADLAKQFNHRNQQLLNLNSSLGESVKLAQQASHSKSQFLANMSHEIRTPLNGVLGMIDIALRKEPTTEIKHFLGVAKSSAESLLVLINDILDFSKVEAGKLDIQKIDFNLRRLLSDIVDTIRHNSSSYDVEMVLDLNELESNWVKGDPARIRQIFTNLIANALKFTEDGEIVIKVGLKDIPDRGFILYGSVRDTGIGIAKEKISELFQSFSQVDVASTRQYGGTGLGLAICKQLCELMGGSISVHSKIGEGSRFEFTILLEKSEYDNKSRSVIDLSDLNILVADDNESSRFVISESLKIWKVNVTECSDGEEAYEEILSNYHMYDAIILDMYMPSMTGAELAKKLRSQRQFDEIPLIMISSSDNEGTAEKYAAIGFQAFLVKPFMPEDIHDAINLCVQKDPILDKVKPLLTVQHLQSMRSSNEDENIPEKKYEGHVLLVEDNKINQEVAANIISDLGLTVDVANDGLEALSMLQKDIVYKCIFMDCQMPNMDGYSATKAIRQLVFFKQIPIIAMTANVLKGEKNKCLAAGMDDYLSKPVSFDGVKSKIEKWIK